MRLTSENSSVDKNSGAVFFKQPPELKEIIRLRNQITDLELTITSIENKIDKIDKILELLKGGNGSV